MRFSQPRRIDLPAAWLAAALLPAAMLAAAPPPMARPQSAPPALKDPLPTANAYLQAGQAGQALTLLNSLPPAIADTAGAHNLQCRVRITMEQWDAAAPECERAVRLDPQNSNWHMWYARALGNKAGKASFLSAYSLAKQARAEFEESVRLDPRNVLALADLGDFYRQAPGIVGGGIDKAQGIAAQLGKLDPARAHELNGQIAEQQKDYAGAERELKQAVAVNPHPALSWTSLASFYERRKRYAEMETALHSAHAAALRDKHASVALYDAAGILIESKQDSAFAAKLLTDYLAAPIKTEEAPVFIAHLRLTKLKDQLGDAAGANRERQAAILMAPDYKPLQDSGNNASNH